MNCSISRHDSVKLISSLLAVIRNVRWVDTRAKLGKRGLVALAGNGHLIGRMGQYRAHSLLSLESHHPK
jgi:uncharacterized protein YbaP (TraB family)